MLFPKGIESRVTSAKSEVTSVRGPDKALEGTSDDGNVTIHGGRVRRDHLASRLASIRELSGYEICCPVQSLGGAEDVAAHLVEDDACIRCARLDEVEAHRTPARTPA